MSDVDYSNFDASDAPSERKFSILEPGTYVFRVTGYQRSKTKRGDDSLIFKLVALEGMTPGCTTGDCIWFVNLTKKGFAFVAEAVRAVQGESWKGNLESDDDVKQAFLGRILKGRITHDHRGAKTYASVGSVEAFGGTDEYCHQLADEYWNNPALGRKQEPGPAKPSGDAEPKGQFDDDDIPF